MGSREHGKYPSIVALPFIREMKGPFSADDLAKVSGLTVPQASNVLNNAQRKYDELERVQAGIYRWTNGKRTSDDLLLVKVLTQVERDDGVELLVQDEDNGQVFWMRKA